jgi:hypothetical protein
MNVHSVDKSVLSIWFSNSYSVDTIWEYWFEGPSVYKCVP